MVTTPDMISIAQLAERFPVGNDPVQFWRKLLARWTAEGKLIPLQHFHLKQNGSHPYRIYRLRKVLRLCWEEGRQYHASCMLQNLILEYGQQIVDYLTTPPAPAVPEVSTLPS